MTTQKQIVTHIHSSLRLTNILSTLEIGPLMYVCSA
jgi:hypothetical protein